jgi:hypothetical protein
MRPITPQPDPLPSPPNLRGDHRVRPARACSLSRGRSPGDAEVIPNRLICTRTRADARPRSAAQNRRSDPQARHCGAVDNHRLLRPASTGSQHEPAPPATGRETRRPASRTGCRPRQWRPPGRQRPQAQSANLSVLRRCSSFQSTIRHPSAQVNATQLAACSGHLAITDLVEPARNQTSQSGKGPGQGQMRAPLRNRTVDLLLTMNHRQVP